MKVESWEWVLPLMAGWGVVLAFPRVQVTYSQSGTRDKKFINPKGIFVDRVRREIYVADPGSHSVYIFNEIGIPLYSFVHRLRGEKKLGEPSDLVVDRNGNIYLVDLQADYVDILNPRGRSIGEIKFDEIKDLHNKKIIPVEIAIDLHGNLYIGIDGDEACVLVFDSCLNFLRKIGKRGDRRGEFQHITGLSVSEDGKLYVTDIRASYCVQVFDREGNFIFGFGKHEEGWENFSFPSGVVRTKDGTIWVVDALRQVVKAFDRNGKFITYFGGKGRRPGELLFPSDIDWDGEQRLVVLERVGRRFQIFEIKGEAKGGAYNE